jgi:hypothetical protein
MEKLYMAPDGNPWQVTDDVRREDYVGKHALPPPRPQKENFHARP